MTISRERVLETLARIALPGGGTLVSCDMVRALNVDSGVVRFVIEASDPTLARALAPVEAEAQRLLSALPGVEKVQIVTTAPAGPRGAPPQVAASSGPPCPASSRIASARPKRLRGRPVQGPFLRPDAQPRCL